MHKALHEGIFKIVERDDERVVIELSDAGHPVFQAHFEGNPLLPGYMQIDIIASILAKSVDEIGSAKYMKPVLPESRIVYSVKEKNGTATVTVTNPAGEKMSAMKLRWHDL